jgi:hypothetical protein
VSDRQQVVFDTSSLIGAMLRPDSVPRQALLTALGACELAVCGATLHELRADLQGRPDVKDTVLDSS